MIFESSGICAYLAALHIKQGFAPAFDSPARLEDLSGAVGVIETALNGKNFLVNNAFSVADICVAYHLYWYKLCPEFEKILNAHPQISNDLESMQERDAAITSKVFSYEG